MSEPNSKRRRCDSPRNEPSCGEESSKELSDGRDQLGSAVRAAAVPVRQPVIMEAAREVQPLPPEVWAHVMEYLTFTEVAKTALLSKTFLNDVMPLIRFLYMDNEKACQSMHRFKNVEEIVLDCLFDARDDALYAKKWAFNGALARFLSSFDNLKHVFLGHGKQETTTKIQERLQSTGNDVYISEEGGPRARGWPLAVKSLCDAYRQQYLSQELMIHGLPSAWLNSGLCNLICSSFPIQQVAMLKPVNNSYFPSRLGRPETASLRIDAVAKRRGGREHLKSKETELFCALVTKTRYTSRLDDPRQWNDIITYPHSVLQAMRQLSDLNCHAGHVTADALSQAFHLHDLEDIRLDFLMKESVYQTLLEVGFRVDSLNPQVVPDVKCR